MINGKVKLGIVNSVRSAILESKKIVPYNEIMISTGNRIMAEHSKFIRGFLGITENDLVK